MYKKPEVRNIQHRAQSIAPFRAWFFTQLVKDLRAIEKLNGEDWFRSWFIEGNELHDLFFSGRFRQAFSLMLQMVDFIQKKRNIII